MRVCLYGGRFLEREADLAAMNKVTLEVEATVLSGTKG